MDRAGRPVCGSESVCRMSALPKEENMDKPLVTIPLQDLRAVMPFMGDRDIRYYLNGVYVEPHAAGCLLVATNGHVAAVIDSKEARCDVPRILALSTPKFRTAIPRAGGTLDIATADARAVLHDKSGIERFILPGKPFIDGKFPEWRQIVPPREHLKPGLATSIAARYLAVLDKVEINNSSGTPVSFWHDGRNPASGPVVARFGGMHDLIVFVMPIRDANPATTWPSWLMTLSPPKATEAAA